MGNNESPVPNFNADVLTITEKAVDRTAGTITSGALFMSGAKLMYNHTTSGAIGILFDG